MKYSSFSSIPYNEMKYMERIDTEIRRDHIKQKNITIDSDCQYRCRSYQSLKTSPLRVKPLRVNPRRLSQDTISESHAYPPKQIK